MAEQFSFRRNSRLTTASDFQSVFNANLRIGNSFMTLLVSKHNSKQSRLGFAIAKKQVKKAVDRNRLKRIFRDSFRHHQAVLPNKDFVIMVKHKIVFQNNHQVFEMMNKNWKTVIEQCQNC